MNVANHLVKSILTLVIITVLNYTALAQISSSNWLGTGLDIQAYPAGYIFAFRNNILINDRSSFSFRFGYNLARRQDFGVHDEERGGGPGFSIGYRFYLIKSQYLEGLFLEARTDLWFMSIDWEDRVGNQAIVTGNTFIVVLQPTGVAGYEYVFNRIPLAIEAGIAFGVEWNMVTNGEEVGQGGISLAHLGITYRF